MAWLNRDLQKIILEFMADNPTNKICAYKIILFLFNKTEHDHSLSPKFSLKAEYGQIAQKLDLAPEQISQTKNDFKNNDKFTHFTNDTKTTIGKWEGIIRNNMVYLTGHKLLSSIDNTNYQITSKGIDFIQNDGGLSAILNVQTVKFHTDTINDMRSLLETYIQNSSLSDEEKSKFSEQISQLSEEAIKIIFTKLVEKGLDNIPVLASSLWEVLLTLVK